MNKTVLIVEDERPIVEILKFNLKREGYDTLEALDGRTGLELAQTKDPDLILLDVMLPDEDGLQILAKLHANPATSEIPVIMLTAKGTEFDKVKGLDLGADDYIVKPFGMAELAARVRARLRRISPKTETDVLTAGPLTLDHRAHTVRVAGEAISLTMKEYDLLKILMENAGIAFTREQLLDRVWDYSYDGGTRTVDVHIQTLRAKLGEYGSMIETVRGVGYRFGGV